MSMKIVITGGTGLIGRALAKRLHGEGHQVIVLSRNPEKVTAMPQGVLVAEWDARTEKGWLAHAEGADAIVNLAGASIDNRWTATYKKRILESRVQAGAAVSAAVKAAKDKPKAVIQASAVGYYGARKDELITEDAAPGKDFLAEVCQQWEASSAEVEKHGVRRAIIRTGLVLSTQGGALGRLLPIYKLGGGGPVGSGKQFYPWIHIGDEIDAIYFLIQNQSANGVFNLTAPNPVTTKEFAKALGKALNRPAITPTPALALKLMFGEMSTIILDGQRAIPTRLQEAGYVFRFLEPEAAFRHLLYSGVEKP